MRETGLQPIVSNHIQRRAMIRLVTSSTQLVQLLNELPDVHARNLFIRTTMSQGEQDRWIMRTSKVRGPIVLWQVADHVPDAVIWGAFADREKEIG